MVTYFKNKFALSEKGAKDFIQAVIWTTVLNLSFMAPIMFGTLLINDIILKMSNPDMALEISFSKYGIPLLISFILMLLIAYRQYEVCFTRIYEESAKRRISLAEKLRILPLAFFSKKDVSDLSATIMEDATQLEQLFSHTVPQIYAAVISIIIMGGMLFSYHWKMAIAVFWVVPLAIAVFTISRKFQFGVHKKLYESKRDVSDQVQEVLELAQEIKSYNRENHYTKLLKDMLYNQEKSMIKGELLVGACVNLSYIFLKLGLPSVILLGAYLVSLNELTVFGYIVFLIVTSRIYNPIMELMDSFSALQFLNVRIKRMKEMEQMPHQEGTKVFKPTNYDIEFNNVGFSYDDGTEVIKGASFTAKQGCVTALVGPSGGGKSTLAKLAARFWDIQEGVITLGGQDISKVDPETLLENYSIVFQDVTLFNNSVLENIRLGRKDASDEDVITAAKQARCHEFIENLPNGYNTVIGENGERLSGGERQRISIARAILKDAPIVLLDEATASLDAENETKVQAALSELIKNRTVLVIAHRMRTVLGADKIVVIKDGKIEDNDHPEVLKNKEGIFSTMLQLQYSS